MPNPLDPERERLLIKKTLLDQAAFHELYSAYFPKIYAYASYHVRQTHEAEDLVADIFLKAVEHLREFAWRGPGSFAAWLFRIAHNRVTDFYRQDQLRSTVLSWEELPDIETNDGIPGNGLVEKEEFYYLRRLVSTLSPRRQEIITLKFFGGLRNHEIASLLGLDERTVASHLCRGLEDLHRRYRDELPGSAHSWEERATEGFIP